MQNIELSDFIIACSNIRGYLKPKRYVNVQVVLLLTLTELYQGFDHEVVLKYGDGDISESS